MEPKLYKLACQHYLPVLTEPEQQVDWSNNKVESPAILLFLKDFDLKKEHLKKERYVVFEETDRARKLAINVIRCFLFFTVIPTIFASLSIPAILIVPAPLWLASIAILSKAQCASAASTKAASLSAALLNYSSNNNKTWDKSRREFVWTGRIKGKLFLTPCLQKVWISHYGLEFLEKVSY